PVGPDRQTEDVLLLRVVVDARLALGVDAVDAPFRPRGGEDGAGARLDRQGPHVGGALQVAQHLRPAAGNAHDLPGRAGAGKDWAVLGDGEAEHLALLAGPGDGHLAGRGDLVDLALVAGAGEEVAFTVLGQGPDVGGVELRERLQAPGQAQAA